LGEIPHFTTAYNIPRSQLVDWIQLLYFSPKKAHENTLIKRLMPKGIKEPGTRKLY